MKYKHCDTPSLPGYHQIANDNSEIKFSLLPDEIVIPILYLIFHYSLVYMQISRRVSISSSDSVKSVNGNCRELVLFVSFGSYLFHSFEVIILWNKLNQTNSNVWSFRTASPPWNNGPVLPVLTTEIDTQTWTFLAPHTNVGHQDKTNI